MVIHYLILNIHTVHIYYNFCLILIKKKTQYIYMCVCMCGLCCIRKFNDITFKYNEHKKVDAVQVENKSPNRSQ